MRSRNAFLTLLSAFDLFILSLFRLKGYARNLGGDFQGLDKNIVVFAHLYLLDSAVTL